MTALSQGRIQTIDYTSRLQLTLASGQKAYKGSLIAVTLGAGTCVVATATTGIFLVGTATADVDATSAAQPIEVDTLYEMHLEWLNNHTSGAVAATDIGYLCYIQDDQTVTMTSTGRTVCGRVWAVDSTKGVLVERLQIGAEYATALASLMRLTVGAVLTFTAGNTAPTTITSGGLYLCPATDAASTITLPTAAATGTWAVFKADGTANDYNVTFVDGGDSSVITRVLPAGKQWSVLVFKAASGWEAIVTIDGGKPLAMGELVAPDTGDIIVTAAAIINGGVYTLPDLAANSTVTLPVIGVADGTQITVCADGGQGAYTTTYRYGTTAISAALTESKAHQAVCTKYGSAWTCTTTVSP